MYNFHQVSDNGLETVLGEDGFLDRAAHG